MFCFSGLYSYLVDFSFMLCFVCGGTDPNTSTKYVRLLYRICFFFLFLSAFSAIKQGKLHVSTQQTNKIITYLVHKFITFAIFDGLELLAPVFFLLCQEPIYSLAFLLLPFPLQTWSMILFQSMKPLFYVVFNMLMAIFVLLSNVLGLYLWISFYEYQYLNILSI